MIKTTLKFVFAFGIIFWLIKNGQLDFALIKEIFNYPANLLTAFFILTFNVLVTTYRWKLLVDIKTTLKVRFLHYLKLTWIGLFFNTVLPGSVTGDLVKLVYSKEIDKTLTRSFLFTTIFLDRLMGLMGLVILMGISSIINYNELSTISEKTSSLIAFNFLLFAGAILFLIFIFLPNKIQKYIINPIELIPWIGEKIKKIFEMIWLIGENKKTIFYTLLLSFLNQAGNIFAFWILITPFLTTKLSIFHAFTFIPIGLITVAIPISPQGLGVGHAVFETLFNIYKISNGASLFNIYFLTLIFVCLLGAIPYIINGKKINLKEERFED